MASSATAVCAAPADYGDLFILYGPEIRRVVRRKLGALAGPEDVDDGVAYILQQFIKNDVIGQYIPGYINDYNHKPTTFKAFIMAKVPLYCQGLAKTLYRREGRETLTLDAPAGDSGEMTRGDLAAPVYDAYPSVAEDSPLRDALAARAPRQVVDMFDALNEQVMDGKVASADAVYRRLGMTRPEAAAWFGQLQEVLTEVTAAPAPAPVREPLPPQGDPETAAWFEDLRVMAGAGFLVGGLLLSEQEVRAAVTALKAGSSNTVLPAWRRAGHRLAGQGKTWYLAFADTVMREYPALRTPKGGHFEGGHFGRVKNALIYGLQCLIGEAPEILPVPEPARRPEPEPVPAALVPEAAPLTAQEEALWTQLGAAISKLPGFSGEKAEADFEAVRLLAVT